jgi:hypothetical protein
MWVFFYINEFFLLFWLDSIVLYRLVWWHPFLLFVINKLEYNCLNTEPTYYSKGYTLFILLQLFAITHFIYLISQLRIYLI